MQVLDHKPDSVLKVGVAGILTAVISSKSLCCVINSLKKEKHKFKYVKSSHFMHPLVWY